MPITQVITALPAPPDPNTPATFATLADPFTVAIVAMRAEYNTLATQANTLAAAMNAAATGGALAVDYTFSSTTTDADPGAGTLRLSAATQNTATVIRTDLLDSAGADWTTILDTLDDSTSTVKAFLKLHKASDGAAFIMWSVSAVATVSGYRNITVAPVMWSAASPFANGDALVLQFTRNGDKGDTGATGAGAVGFTLNSQSAAYTLVLSDKEAKAILHPSADTTARIFTIPANAAVAYDVGTVISFINQNGAGVLTIAITTDTMRLAGPGTTGSRTLAANGIATAIKLTATEWIISGSGLS